MKRHLDGLCLTAFIRARRGAAAVEFALIAIPICILIFGSIQNILVSLARISLDTALQSLAYDVSNGSADKVAQMLTRDKLCSYKAFYLIDCTSSTSMCFSVQTLSISAANPPLSKTCESKPNDPIPSSCCYVLTAQYSIPLSFDFLLNLISPGSAPSGKNAIRSVALVYRG